MAGPTPEQARERAWTDAERAGVADRVDTQFVGHADRVRSTELLARAWAE